MAEEKDFKKLAIIILVVGLLILALFMLEPIAISIFFGVILAYIFHPLLKKLNKKLKSKNLSALIIVGGMLVIILIPMIILIPIVTRQVVDVYLILKDKDFSPILANIFPSMFGSPSRAADISAIMSSFTSKIASAFISFFQDWIFNIPNIILQIAIIIFTFFFVMRDQEIIKEYALAISPFEKEHQKKLYKKFQEVTNSVLYGEVIVGIVQGLIAGIGYFVFGVNKALLLTFFTMIASIIPIFGAWIIWVPVVIYLFSTNQTTPAVGLLIYGAVVVSWIDNLIRPFIVSKLSKMNTGIVLIGMFGGLYAFGILGLIIGPLILAYLLLIAEFYKEKGFKSILIEEPKKETAGAGILKTEVIQA